MCPYHSDKEWMRLRSEEPQAFQEAVQFERDYNHAVQQQTGSAKLKGEAFLTSYLVPLDQVQFDSSKTLDLFGNECEGMCGV